MEVNPAHVAERFRAEVRDQASNLNLKLVGLLTGADPASRVYSDYTRIGCEDVGVEYEVREVQRMDLEKTIRQVNTEKDVTGVIVYYPVFGSARDAHLRSLLSPLKDVEGLHPFWLGKLYANQRVLPGVETHPPAKALLPCTPLAIVKLLEAAGEMDSSATATPFKGKTITIFNRSEVVGRPLAFMLANDGAKVFSFDINGAVLFSPGGNEQEVSISRGDALKTSDIVITGVPTQDFELIRSDELKDSTCCLNFSSFKNFAAEVPSVAKTFIPRVGPVTVAMCLRNLLRIHKQFSELSSGEFVFE